MLMPLIIGRIKEVMKKIRIKTELLVHDRKNPFAVIEASADMLVRNARRKNPLTERR
jgi:hypothetical protein